MKNEFIPYEQSSELKELGFDESCLKEFHKCTLLTNSCGEEMTNSELIYLYGEEGTVIAAPLYQQAFRWFREKHNLDVTFRKMDYGLESQFTGYYFSINRGNELIDIHGADKRGKIYEDSELKCLKKLIEIVKNK